MAFLSSVGTRSSVMKTLDKLKLFYHQEQIMFFQNGPPRENKHMELIFLLVRQNDWKDRY